MIYKLEINRVYPEFDSKSTVVEWGWRRITEAQELLDDVELFDVEGE